MTPSFHNPVNSAVHTRSRPPGSSFATEKLKPLTQLNSPPDLATRPYSENVSTERSSMSGGTFQSEHSRRGSMASHHSLNSSTAPNSYLNNLHGLPTTQASMPKLSLGNRFRPNGGGPDQAQAGANGPHPYDVILPGEEQPNVPLRSRTMSVATACATATISDSANRSRSFGIGARRFTQTAHAPAHSGPHIGTTHPAAALHARRYSSVAREPFASRASSCAGDVFEEDDHTQDSKKLAKTDTQILLVSFKSLLGRDGGGEAVEKLIAFLIQGGLSKVKDDLAGIVKHVLQSVPTLQAAYVSVHLHEITEQIQKIGGLLVSEPELMPLYDTLYKRFRGLGASNAAVFQNSTFSNILNIVTDKLSASPVYQSALLNLIDTFCKLVLASEKLRDGLWSSLSEAFSQTPSSRVESTSTTHVANFLSMLFAAIEQLTGSSIKPLVKSFIAWVAIVDDSLTNLASETRDLLAQPLSIPIVPPSDYTTHPFGYIYSPAEASAKLDVVMQKWRAVYKEEPVHKSAFDYFKRAFDNMLSAISGNSTFARFSRDLVRVWTGIMGSSEGVVGTGFEGGLECLKNLASEFIEIPVASLKTQDQQVDLTVSDFKLSVMDAFPLEIGFSIHSRLFPSDFSSQKIFRLEMKDLQLDLKNGCLIHLKDGTTGLSHRSTVMFRTKVDLNVDFVPQDITLSQMFLSLPFYGGSVVKVSSSNIELSSVTDLEIPHALLAQLKSQLHQRIETTVQEYLDSFFKIWFAVKPMTSKNPSAAQKNAIKLPGAGSKNQTFTSSHKLPETYGNSRDQFKASIRNMTGIKTSSVLHQLQNPLSAEGSPVVSPSHEEDPHSKRKRRQSMADYLTNISKADSTLPENIERPPVAEPHHRGINSLNLPNVFDEDEDDLPVEFVSMARTLSISARGDGTSIDKIIRPIVSSQADVNSVLSHRGGMPHFPMVEMSYEAYEKAEATLDGQAHAPAMEIGGQHISSMAESLSELATRDTTTEEAIAHPPTIKGISQDQLHLESGENLTMDKITRHLSGFVDSTEVDSNATPRKRVFRRDPAPPELSSKVVMANLLTNMAMEDNTLPETQATGCLSGPVKGAGVPVGENVTSLSEKEIVAMRDQLSKMAATDMTLSSNIAAPPCTQHVYRGAPSDSFTGLKVLRSMSTTLNDISEKDYTTPEAQAELYRMKPQGPQVTGFTEQEMKQRRQSFKLTDEAMKDATLIETIKNPPIVTSRTVPV